MRTVFILPAIKFILSLLIIFPEYCFTQNTIETYYNSKIQEIMKSHYKREGYFTFSVMPMTIEWMIGQSYSNWLEKRYTKEEMISKAKALIKESEGSIHVMLTIAYLGDWNTEGETSKIIPSDIAEYIFIENEQGEYVRCEEADSPLGRSTVGIYNEISNISLKFPDAISDTGKSIFNNSKKIRFVIGGLGFKDNQIEYDLPLSSLFLDSPQDVKEIYYEIGLWKPDYPKYEESTSAEIHRELTIQKEIELQEAEKKQLQIRFNEIEKQLTQLREEVIQTSQSIIEIHVPKEPDVLVRTGPSNQYPEFGRLAESDTLYVIGKKVGWIEFRLTPEYEGWSGWCRSPLVRKITNTNSSAKKGESKEK